MLRRTKIVATLGPASRDPLTLKAMLSAGVNVFRINFSHAGPDFIETIQLVRELAAELNQPLAIMADLQGPKIRIGCFKNGSVKLREGQTFTLHCENSDAMGDEQGVSVVYTHLCHELQIGDHLLLDDGFIELRVTKIEPPLIECTVIEGGQLSNKKGINRKGGGLSAGALTSKDKTDLASAIHAGVDYIALSFVKDANDIKETRALMNHLGVKPVPIISKIERTEALEHLDEIISASDAILVARGDLGVEIGAAEVPAIQKHIIKQTKQLNKVVITATQMMESMIHQPQPTRAEVSDVANAILDGTDAVMLSAETASGLYPIKVIKMVNQICLSAEKHAAFSYPAAQNSPSYQRTDQAISNAAMHVANHFPVKAIIALTESGASAIWMSRMQSAVPIYAISANEETVRQLSLVNNVFPLYFDYRQTPKGLINQEVIDYLLNQKLVCVNEHVLLTRGSLIGKPGGTNRMEIVEVI